MSRVRRFVTKYELVWHLLTVGIYGAAIGLLIVVFPGVSNLWVSILVMVAGFTASVTAMIACLKERGER